MRVVGMAEARANLGRLTNRVSQDGEEILLTRRGELLAALVPVDSRRLDDEAIHDNVGLRANDPEAARAASDEEGLGESEAQFRGIFDHGLIGMAHDFNNLLAVILGSAEFLGDRLGQEHRTQLQAIVRAGERGAELAKSLLDSTRKQASLPRTFELEELIAGMRPLLRQSLGRRTKIETDLAPALWPIRADPGQLESALLNLAINAGDAMPDGGSFTIAGANVALDRDEAAPTPGALSGDFVVVSVSDSGTGMPREVRERAFEPFFTTKPMGQGTGLGLSMVYGFAKQSGGLAKLESEPERGTTVRLYLPRAKRQAALDR